MNEMAVFLNQLVEIINDGKYTITERQKNLVDFIMKTYREYKYADKLNWKDEN